MPETGLLCPGMIWIIQLDFEPLRSPFLSLGRDDGGRCMGEGREICEGGFPVSFLSSWASLHTLLSGSLCHSLGFQSSSLSPCTQSVCRGGRRVPGTFAMGLFAGSASKDFPLFIHSHFFQGLCAPELPSSNADSLPWESGCSMPRSPTKCPVVPMAGLLPLRELVRGKSRLFPTSAHSWMERAVEITAHGRQGW